MEKYEISMDRYHGRYKLELYEWDGTPKQPMFLAYRPPKMLPTSTIAVNTIQTAAKRWTAPLVPLAQKHTNTIWWVGLGLIAIGSIGYLVVS